MTKNEPLIPPPPVIRVRLAENIRERQLLRSLLRLSVKQDEDKQFIREISEGLQTTTHEVARAQV
jgi:hypothetical protein